MNVTWWYMSVIIVYYVLYPIIHRLLEKYAEIILIFSIASALLLPNIRELQLWIAPFVFGSYISKYNGFEKISRLLNTRLKQIVFCSVLIVLAAYIRYFRFGNTPKCDFLFAFSIILFCYFIIGRIPIVNRVLEELGKKSGLIFMFHTFIYSYYFKEFIYSFKYSVIIFIIMLVICYAIAWFIHWLMNITGYTKMIKKVTS